MKFAYTILYVPDVSRSLDFYESAFGLKRRFLHESGLYGELETGGTTLSFAAEPLAQSNLPGGFEPASLTRRPAASEVGFATADVPAAFQRALTAGAVQVAAPNTKPWGQVVAYVRDPDGHLIELCTPMH
jgi:lactoylglutathione lyase